MQVTIRIALCAMLAVITGQAIAQEGSPYDTSPLGRYHFAEPELPPISLQQERVQPVQHLAWTEPRLAQVPRTTARADLFSTQSPRYVSQVGHRQGGGNCCGTPSYGYHSGTPSYGDTSGTPNYGCASCEADKGQPCCVPAWAHRSGIFGGYLVLRPRNADVSYAVAIDGGINPPILPPPVQRGPVATTDPEFNSAYQIGGTIALDCQTSLVVAFTRFESNTTDTVSTSAPLALRQLVLHPQSANATADYLDATANLGLIFNLVDADYRSVLWSNDRSAINYVVGIRYGRFEQDFAGEFTNAGTTELLNTGVDFEGLGLRLGLDGERHFGSRGLFVYGRTTVNFLGGESSGYYTQSTSPATPTVDTSWSAARFVTILDLELGGGWQSCCGRWRVSGGYQINSWRDLVTADQFIEGVQNNNFVDMSDSIVFDGLNAKFEYRW